MSGYHLTAHRLSRRGLAIIAIIMTSFTVVGVAAAISLGVSITDVLVGVCGLFALGAILAMPVHWIPAFALLVLTFFPSRFIPNDGPFRALPPLTVLLVVWAFRRTVLGQSASPERVGLGPLRPRAARLAIYLPAVFLLLWLLYSVATSVSTRTSVSWTISFVLALGAPMLVMDSRREGLLLRRTLMWSGALLGAYAFVEVLLGSSPIYGAIYQALGTHIDRDWSVYRAFASFSHPLAAAAYFTVPTMLSLSEWLRTAKVKYLVYAGLGALGIFATVSRGSILAIAIGAGFVFLCYLFSPSARTQGRMAGMVVLGLIGGLFAASFGPLQERSDSLEGGLSDAAREVAVSVALKAAAYGRWLGTGPGTSGQTSRRFDGIVIENSMLQLLISIGVPGLLLVLALLGGIIYNSLSHGDVGAAAATVALTISFTGFNVIDAVLYLHILLGTVVLLSLSSDAFSVGRAQTASASHFFPVPVSATSGGHSWT